MKILEGKTAIITGGGTGIGRATALLFARSGARVALADFNPKEGTKTAGMVRDEGGDSFFMQMDVRKSDEVARMVTETIKKYGRVDIAFNNAGIWGKTHARLDEIDEDEAQAVLDTNLRGVWLCMRYELKAMLKQGGGVIINNASIAGIAPSATEAIYSASKHGVVGLTRSVSQEYAADNIRVVAVCPGWIKTPLIADAFAEAEFHQAMLDIVPLKRLGEPEDVAELVLWLASDSASYMTGSIIPISGGLCI